MTTTTPVNAIIYTRKSTDDGLDMEFNSLDAQFEAAAAYIAQRQHLGWRLSPVRYDDGGYTGGNLERPALRRLLRDIEAGQVQVVVAYKLDRIIRSLIDFAHLMAFFEQHQVAFVSVTQEFDSSTPVGRLTLNILSSFAQFEREIISERTRDKMAASRRKGLFTGGIPPYGYRIDPITHQLVIDPVEAPVVARIYRDYLSTHSVTAIVRALNGDGIPSKRYQAATGRVLGAGPGQRPWCGKSSPARCIVGMSAIAGRTIPAAIRPWSTPTPGSRSTTIWARRRAQHAPPVKPPC